MRYFIAEIEVIGKVLELLDPVEQDQEERAQVEYLGGLDVYLVTMPDFRGRPMDMDGITEIQT